MTFHDVLAWLQAHLPETVSLLAALGALWRWAASPLRKLNERLRLLDEDLADLLWDRLEQEHEEAMALGRCSAAQKRRLTTMHRRYSARGRNHLAADYEKDILALPEQAVSVQHEIQQ